MRKSEDWLKEHVARTGRGYTDSGTRVAAPAAVKTSEKKKGRLACELSQPARVLQEHAPPIGKRKKNKTEARFERDFLVPALLSGKLQNYKFERIKLILGDGTTYTPDFSGTWANGVQQFWEIKGGYIHEDARVKFNCAADQFQEYAFELYQWKGGEWRVLKSIRAGIAENQRL